MIIKLLYTMGMSSGVAIGLLLLISPKRFYEFLDRWITMPLWSGQEGRALRGSDTQNRLAGLCLATGCIFMLSIVLPRQGSEALGTIRRVSGTLTRGYGIIPAIAAVMLTVFAVEPRLAVVLFKRWAGKSDMESLPSPKALLVFRLICLIFLIVSIYSSYQQFSR